MDRLKVKYQEEKFEEVPGILKLDAIMARRQYDNMKSFLLFHFLHLFCVAKLFLIFELIHIKELIFLRSQKAKIEKLER